MIDNPYHMTAPERNEMLKKEELIDFDMAEFERVYKAWVSVLKFCLRDGIAVFRKRICWVSLGKKSIKDQFAAFGKVSAELAYRTYKNMVYSYGVTADLDSCIQTICDRIISHCDRIISRVNR
jgi:hypothetical protein